MSEPGERVRLVALELAAMAQTGLTFASDRYDVVRYTRLRELSAELLDVLGSAGTVPIRAALDLDGGYATPHLDVRGALFDPVDRVLLVREASDGCWTLPGGWADPLDSPSHAVEREFAEEAGLAVRAARLVAVWDGMVSNGHRRSGSPFHIWKLFYLCEPLDPAATPEAGRDGETTEVGYFALDALPELSGRRTTAEQLRRLLAHHRDPSLPPTSD